MKQERTFKHVLKKANINHVQASTVSSTVLSQVAHSPVLLMAPKYHLKLEVLPRTSRPGYTKKGV